MVAHGDHWPLFEEEHRAFGDPLQGTLGSEHSGRLLEAWTREDGGQAFVQEQHLLILQIRRFVWTDSGRAKHQQELRVGEHVTIPVSEDGMYVGYEDCKVTGLIMHSGEGRRNGHFTCIHKFQEVPWFADDNQTPVMLATQTAQHCKEIVRVWLVRIADSFRNSVDRAIEQEQKEATDRAESLRKRCKVEAFNFQVGTCHQVWQRDPINGCRQDAFPPCSLRRTHGDEMKQAIQQLTRMKWKVLRIENSGRGGIGFVLSFHPHPQASQSHHQRQWMDSSEMALRRLGSCAHCYLFPHG